MYIVPISFPTCLSITRNYSAAGLTIHCPGNPGHGSRFIENTAVEKVVRWILRNALIRFGVYTGTFVHVCAL